VLLTDKTYLVGSTPTAADLALFAALHPTLVSHNHQPLPHYLTLVSVSTNSH